jgi:hypothetical protein
MLIPLQELYAMTSTKAKSTASFSHIRDAIPRIASMLLGSVLRLCCWGRVIRQPQFAPGSDQSHNPNDGINQCADNRAYYGPGYRTYASRQKNYHRSGHVHVDQEGTRYRHQAQQEPERRSRHASDQWSNKPGQQSIGRIVDPLRRCQLSGRRVHAASLSGQHRLE